MLKEKGVGLIIFDVEGVLIPKNRYLLFELGRNLRLLQFLKIIFYGILYELGLVSLKFALKRIFRVFEGFRVEKLLEIFRKVPLMLGVEFVFEELRSRGWKIALISSGLPNYVVEDLALRLGANYGFGFCLEEKGGVVTGEISGDVIERDGKLLVLRRILEKEGLGSENCVVVADDRNNGPMMLPGMLKIGFHPDFVVRFKADHVVSGWLVEILPLVKGEKQTKRALPSRNEVFRELIHACGFSVPFLSFLFGVPAVVYLIVAVTLFYLASELAVMEGKSLPVVSSIKRYAATSVELYEFAFAPVFFALGILFALVLFPASVSFGAIAIFSLGDSAAAIFGKIFGRRTLPFNKGKTLEGSIMGILFGFLGALFFVEPLEAFVGAVVAMVVECLPLPISDNLAVPLATGIVLTFMV